MGGLLRPPIECLVPCDKTLNKALGVIKPFEILKDLYKNIILRLVPPAPTLRRCLGQLYN